MAPIMDLSTIDRLISFWTYTNNVINIQLLNESRYNTKALSRQDAMMVV